MQFFLYHKKELKVAQLSKCTAKKGYCYMNVAKSCLQRAFVASALQSYPDNMNSRRSKTEMFLIHLRNIPSTVFDIRSERYLDT